MIEVRRTAEHDPLIFEVVVREGKGETRHHVTMSREMCERLTAGKVRLPRRQPCDRSLSSQSRWPGRRRPVPLPMPAHGAGPLDWVVRVVGIPRQRNAWPRCAALAAFATRIHSPGRPTGPRPGTGIPRTRHGAIGAALNAQSPRRGSDASRSDHRTYCGTV